MHIRKTISLVLNNIQAMAPIFHQFIHTVNIPISNPQEGSGHKDQFGLYMRESTEIAV